MPRSEAKIVAEPLVKKDVKIIGVNSPSIENGGGKFTIALPIHPHPQTREPLGRIMADTPYFVEYEQALDIVRSHPLDAEEELVPLDEAAGRTLASDLTSHVNDPPFDNSAMDGFACYYDGHTTLDSYTIVGQVQAAKDEQHLDVEPGQTVRIMTGAPLPSGCNAIIPIEQTEIDHEHQTVRFLTPPKIHFVRKCGENITKGEIGLPKGTHLGPAQLGMCATMGHDFVSVFKKYTIGILSTGDELKPPGTELEYGEIYESNSYGLAALVRWMGHIPIRYPAVHDSIEALREAMNIASEECDLILTSGGVSMGEFDFVRILLEDEGEVKFWRMKLRPGSPPIFGTWNNTPIFGLPGNPVSSHIVFRMLVAPFLRASHYTNLPAERRTRAKLKTTVKGTKDCLTLRRVILTHTEEGFHAFQPKHQGSGNLDSLSTADGLTMLAPGEFPKIDDWVDVLIL